MRQQNGLRGITQDRPGHWYDQGRQRRERAAGAGKAADADTSGHAAAHTRDSTPASGPGQPGEIERRGERLLIHVP
jgi:hypothetical protein